MNKEEARAILLSEMGKYRQRTYASLLSLLQELDAYEVAATSGARYQLEIQATWDDRPDGDLRVMGGIDDGGFLSSFAPLTDDFVISPDGQFVGE